MTTLSLTLGSLVLVGQQQGPYINVTVQGCDGHLCITIAEWTSLAAVVDVLAAADKRHAADRAEVEMLAGALRGCEAVRDTAIRLYDQLGEELEQIVGGDGTSLERLKRLAKERDEAFAKVDQLYAAREAKDPNHKLVAFHNQVVDHHEQVVAGLNARLSALQPLLSALGDWDWGGIAADWPAVSDYERAIEAVVKAMAEVERSVGKERNNGH